MTKEEVLIRTEKEISGKNSGEQEKEWKGYPGLLWSPE